MHFSHPFVAALFGMNKYSLDKIRIRAQLQPLILKCKHNHYLKHRYYSCNHLIRIKDYLNSLSESERSLYVPQKIGKLVIEIKSEEEDLKEHEWNIVIKANREKGAGDVVFRAKRKMQNTNKWVSTQTLKNTIPLINEKFKNKRESNF